MVRRREPPGRAGVHGSPAGEVRLVVRDGVLVIGEPQVRAGANRWGGGRQGGGGRVEGRRGGTAGVIAVITQ